MTFKHCALESFTFALAYRLSFRFTSPTPQCLWSCSLCTQLHAAIGSGASALKCHPSCSGPITSPPKYSASAVTLSASSIRFSQAVVLLFGRQACSGVSHPGSMVLLVNFAVNLKLLEKIKPMFKKIIKGLIFPVEYKGRDFPSFLFQNSFLFSSCICISLTAK